MSADPPSAFRHQAIAAVFWSFVQNWGGRALALLVFLLLARLLSPADFGLASSAILVFSFVSLISELGFCDALLQRPTLASRDATLPFYAAIGTAVLLSAAAALNADRIAGWLGTEGLGPFIVWAACVSPISVAAGFQDAMYRRALEFRRLAMRTLAAGIVAGVASVAAALAGLGADALMIQFALQIVVSFVWLWSRPAWLPTRDVDLSTFRPIGAFGLNVVVMRLVDFGAMRTVDLLILLNLGPAALGLFAISSRLYQFLMQLLQASITNAGLAVLSRVSGDPPRMAQLFVRTTSLTAMVCSPVFIGLAALAPEVNRLLFGPRWADAEPIMALLLVVGGIHCLLFGAGAYLTAMGRPGTLLRLILLKAGLVLVPLFVLKPATLQGTATCFAAGLIAEAPFTIHATLAALKLSWSRIVRPVGVPLAACGMGLAAVHAARRLTETPPDSLFGLAIHGGVFAAVYGLVVIALASRSLRENIAMLRASATG